MYKQFLNTLITTNKFVVISILTSGAVYGSSVIVPKLRLRVDFMLKIAIVVIGFADEYFVL